MSPQLPLGLKFTHEPSFDGFVGSADVLDVLRKTVSGQLSASLYLEAATGNGKTHLLLASLALAGKQQRSSRYLPLSVMAGRLQDALAQDDMVEMTCIDGLEHIAGHRDDEVALFHFHNRLMDAKKVILYAAKTSPLGLGLELPDLQSRLSQCMRLNIETLDDEDRRAVLLYRAEQRGLELDATVLDFMFKHIGRDLLSLTILLDKLDRESLAAQRKITVPFLKKQLSM